MATLDDYRIVQRLHQGRCCSVSRAQHLSGGDTVILKQLNRAQASSEQVSRFQHEFEVLQPLHIAGISRPLAQLRLDTGPATLFADTDSVPLRQLISEQRPNWQQWLPVAIAISELLGRLHEAHIIHKQISPDHLLLNRDTGAPELIDFSLSTPLHREQANWHTPELSFAGLAYIAPEQTGRTSRAIDYRTDYYSLGATLYELMTGQPPFGTRQGMELVHSHIAKQPTAPHSINPQLPPLLSSIILKLLAKDAAQRYQSSVGLVHDLRRCLPGAPASSEALGLQDLSARFQIPQQLYGREAELQQLCNGYDRCTAGQPGLVMISGYAGVGKSSLVHELRQYVNSREGSFSSGKFDQFRRNRPYFAVFQALQRLVRQLLTEPEKRIAPWRDALQTALGSQAQVLIKLIPELELIIGPQPEAPSLTPAEEQNRFSRMFVQMLRVFASPERPLVLFLDDLHWADLASLHLLETLVNTRELPHLLLIGSYRDEEVDGDHPLQAYLERFRHPPCHLSELRLAPLDQPQVNRLIADTLRCPLQQCQALATACMSKTQGNPFFLGQFLHTLHDDGLIRFRDQHWQWDEAAIQAQEMTDNVIALMVSTIQRLPASTQQVLPLAACIGSTFNLHSLALVSGQSAVVTASGLWPALTEGLVVPLDDNYRLFQHQDPSRSRYRFVHDRVQQAAYSLIAESRQEALHLQIGRQLQHSLTEDEQHSRIFEISNHLNQARRLIDAPDERLALAQLNLAAGLRAREAAAFDSALNYLQCGLELLPDDAWHSAYSLALKLHTAAAEIAHIRADTAFMQQLTDAVEQHARSLPDRVRIYEIRIQSQVASNHFDRALHLALDLLSQLGVVIPAKPSALQYWRAILRTRWLLQRTSEQDILASKAMTSPELLAAMPLMASMFGVIKFSSSELRPLVMAREVELSIRHGLNPASALAFAGYGGVLCGHFNAIDQGYRLGQLALQIDRQMPACQTHHRTLSLFNSYVRHYREPLALCRDDLLQAYRLGLDCGDIEWGAYALAAYIQYAFTLCRNLDALQPQLEDYTRFLDQSGQQQSLQYSLLTLQTMDNLRGHSSDAPRLDGRFYQQDASLAELERENHRTAICLHHFYSALLCYLLGTPADALRHSQAGAMLTDSISGTFTEPWLRLLDALCILANLTDTPLLARRTRLRRVRQTLHQLRKLARTCPENHLHHYCLLRAEWLRSRQHYAKALDMYEQAIEQAREQGFMLEEALACELAGRLCLDWKKRGMARTYLQDAYARYRDWGARAKLAQMRQQYPQELETRPRDLPAHSGAGALEPASAIDNQAFDISSVISASQAISDEIVLERLLGRLMSLALQTAGAQRASLILRRQQQWFVEAQARLDTEPQLFSARPLEDAGDELPLSIIHYVARTKEILVLGNAVEHPLFQQDSYIRQQQPRSLLCSPILYHGELTAVLYLEHSESRDIFDQDRLKTLQILTAQAAISIENAKLYSSLQQSEGEYRSLFENAIEGIFRIDTGGRFISANPALARLLGYDSPAGFLDEVPDINRQGFANPGALQRFLAILNRQDRAVNFETPWYRRDGSTLFVSVSARRILGEQGDLLYYEGSLSDISERKAKEQAELAREKAEAASEAKSQFLATMSHEIRTPMNGILGMAQLLMRAPLSAEQQTQVKAIYQSGRTLLSILNDVLDFTKIEAGQLTLEQHPFSVRQVVDEIRPLLESLAREKALQLIVRLDNALPERVCGDRRALSQVLLNLGANALKFTQEGYVALRVRCLRRSDSEIRLRFEVEDSGIGIPQSARERIFAHFSQADSTITRRFGGTGLGLSICRRLVELQQGQIDFDSTEGRGSLFWFELDYVQTQAQPPAADTAQPWRPTVPARALDILLVEDTEINQQVSCGLLESEGHSVSIADDGYTALSMHNDHAYDLVLMDIHLPDMDGVETARRMRQHPDSSRAGVRIIALTASVTGPEIQQYLDAGMDAVVGKPLQFSELERLLYDEQASAGDAVPPASTRPENTQASDSVPTAPLADGPGADNTSTDADLLDSSLLAQHRSMLGEEHFDGLLLRMQAQCDSLLTELAETDADQPALLHKLAGTCANFGLVAAAARCRELERSGPPCDSAAQQALRQLYERSIAALP